MDKHTQDLMHDAATTMVAAYSAGAKQWEVELTTIKGKKIRARFTTEILEGEEDGLEEAIQETERETGIKRDGVFKEQKKGWNL